MRRRLSLSLVFAVSACTAISGLDSLEFNGEAGGGGGGDATTSTGSGAGAACSGDADCALEDPCQQGSCVNGTCEAQVRQAGASCGEGMSCDDMGNCLLTPGEPCSTGDECGSGYCVDGVCCNTLCEGDCQGCNNTEALAGSCSQHDLGTDPDDDCIGTCGTFGECQLGDHLSSASFLVAETQDIAVDGQGNYVVVGQFWGQTDFGGGPMQALVNDVEDIFVARFLADGTLDWAQAFAGDGYEWCRGVSLDSQGNIILVGDFNGTLTIGSTVHTAASGYDGFVAKLTSSGAVQWSHRISGSLDQYVYDVDVSSAGEIAIVGYFYNSIDVGSNSAIVSAGDYDGFMALYNTNGAYQWHHTFGDAAFQEVRSVAIGRIGTQQENIAIAGSYRGAINLGGTPFTSTGDNSVFVASFGLDGAHQWSHGFGDSARQRAASVTRDSSGAVLAGGYNEGTVNFGGSDLSSSGSRDAFVAKWDAAGTHVFSSLFGDNLRQETVNVITDSADNVVIAGFMYGAANFGGGSLFSQGDEDVFVAKFNGSGDYLWARAFGGSQGERCRGLGIGIIDDIYFSGRYETSGLDLGGGPFKDVNNQWYNMFVARLSP